MVDSTAVETALVVGALATASEAYDRALDEIGDTEATACRSEAMGAALEAALPLLLDGRVVYEPHALNRQVSALAAREVAARLRERAAVHRWQSKILAGIRDCENEVRWHQHEADVLGRLADQHTVSAVTVARRELGGDAR